MTIDPNKKSALQGFLRGLTHGCPNCGTRSIFKSYLKVKDHCDTCGLALNNYSADDAPPYIVTFLVGTLVVPLAFLTDSLFDMSELMLLAIWLPLTILLILLALPPVKGSFIGVLWALDLKR